MSSSSNCLASKKIINSRETDNENLLNVMKSIPSSEKASNETIELAKSYL